MSLKETVPRVPGMETKPIRGFLKVELFDAESGELVSKAEKENLVTNAIRIGCQAYAATGKMGNFMPLATMGLGGIMLFDDALDADADNILFPKNAHIVGYGTQTVDTENTLRGSKNVAESFVRKGADGRAKTVWDFGTSQANGIISAVALTKCRTPFAPLKNDEVAAIRYHDGDYEGYYSDKAVLAYEDGYVYICRSVTVNTTHTGTSGNYTYTTTYRIDIYKLYAPMRDYKVGDEATYLPTNIDEIYQSITWTQTSGEQAELSAASCICVDYADEDESAYLVWSPGNASGDGRIYVTKITRDGLHWSASDTVIITCAGARLINNYGYVVDGYYVIAANNRASFYKIAVDNPLDIRQVALPEGWMVYTDSGYLRPSRNGVVFFVAYINRTVATQTERAYRRGILYPDGTVVIEGADYTESSDLPGSYISYETPDGNVFGGERNRRVEGKYISNYLGTIANLPTPIVKNASQTLKITYTLVDA